MTHEVLTVADCRRVGFCVKGIKRACEVHKQDFRAMVKHGLPLEEMDKLDDVNVRRAVAEARKRIANEQR